MYEALGPAKSAVRDALQAAAALLAPHQLLGPAESGAGGAVQRCSNVTAGAGSGTAPRGIAGSPADLLLQGAGYAPPHFSLI